MGIQARRHSGIQAFRHSGALALLGALMAGPAGSVGESPVSPARLERISRSYLGTPYKLDALGEAGGPDGDPLFTRKCVDCQTLVEQVMAEAIAPSVGGQARAVRIVRYREEQVRLENRYHYCIPDWLENAWPARDATAAIGGRGVKHTKRRIDLPRFLASRAGNPKLSPIKARFVPAAYIPRSRVAGLPASALDGTIAVWVLSRTDIVAGHVGFLFNKGGKTMFRHASQRRKQVIDQPVAEYATSAPKSVIGLMVLRPDMAGLKR
jgi:hypothetical protein